MVFLRLPAPPRTGTDKVANKIILIFIGSRLKSKLCRITLSRAAQRVQIFEELFSFRNT